MDIKFIPRAISIFSVIQPFSKKKKKFKFLCVVVVKHMSILNHIHLHGSKIQACITSTIINWKDGHHVTFSYNNISMDFPAESILKVL